MEIKKFFHTANLFIRSLVFSILSMVITIFYSVVCTLSWPLPLRWRSVVVRSWTQIMIWLLKHICYLNYHIEGLENIPRDRNGVVLCKHQSTWETFLLPGFFHQSTVIVKRELLWLPFFGWGMATINPIAINRSDKASAMEQVITKGKKYLETGGWVLVYPEGTRIPYGKVGNYRAGGVRLAIAAGDYPVLPIAHNAGRFWPKRKFIKEPGTIQVVIGPVIETKGKTPEQVLTEAKTWIENTIARIDKS